MSREWLEQVCSNVADILIMVGVAGFAVFVAKLLDLV